jgi:hypothetical protein
METLAALYQELLRSGVPEQDIPGIIQQLGQERERRRQRALQSGWTNDALTNDLLFNPNFQGTASLLTGQGEAQREQDLLAEAARAQQARASVGTGLLDYQRSRANDLIDLQRDPFNIVAYLAGIAGLPEGTGNPVQQLIGKDFRIQPSLPSPYQQPEYKRLESSLMDFGRPRTPVENFRESQQAQKDIATEQFGKAAINRLEAARSGSGSDAEFMEGMRRLAAMGKAGGGGVTVTEPTVGIGAFSGRPQFTLAENGPEQMQITPQQGVSQQLDPVQQMAMINAVLPSRAALEAYEVPKRTPLGQASAVQGFAAGTNTVDRYGRVTSPNPYGESGRATGQVGIGRSSTGRAIDPNRPSTARAIDFAHRLRSGQKVGSLSTGRGPRLGVDPNAALRDPSQRRGAAPMGTSGKVMEPVQAAAVSLGKALQTNPFATPDLVQSLLAGKAPLPGSITQRFRNNVSPSLLQALLAVIQGQGIPVDDFQNSVSQFDVPGLRIGSVRYG